MNVPDLRALQHADPDAWDEAFRWLWPTAFAVAQLKLQPYLPEDIEDVAIEALEELVEKVQHINEVEELRPLTASIAHNRAVSRLRERFAAKRGAGITESLEARQDAVEGNFEPAAVDSSLAELGQTELADLLGQLQTELKPEQRAILDDFFLCGLSYEQIARKHNVALGSVGVYLKRGVEAIRKQGLRHPKLLKECAGAAASQSEANARPNSRTGARGEQTTSSGLACLGARVRRRKRVAGDLAHPGFQQVAWANCSSGDARLGRDNSRDHHSGSRNTEANVERITHRIICFDGRIGRMGKELGGRRQEAGG